MSDRLPKRELYGAFAGVSLLAFAMAWRWLMPWWQSIDWSKPSPDAAPEVAAQVQAWAEQAKQGTVPTEPDAAEEEPLPAPGGPLTAEQRAQVADELAAAESAQEDRRWFLPEDDNALDRFARVLTLDPANASARSGRKAVLDAIYAQADTLLDDGDPKYAEDWLAVASKRGIDDRRTPPLALRVTRLTDVRARLAEGAARMADGALFEPADASAVAAFRAALALDSRNRAAAKGLADLENGVLDEALRAASEQRFDDADALLVKAQGIGSDTAQRAETTAKIGALKQRAAEDLLLRAEAALAARDSEAAANWIAQAHALGAPEARVAAIEQRRANAALYASYQPGDRFSDPFKDRSGEGPALVVVPVGAFHMGSADDESGRTAAEGPAHIVRITRPFALSGTEVTVAEFRRFVRETGYRSDAEQVGDSSIYDERTGRIVKRRGVTWENDFSGGRARSAEPVVHVSWRDAAAYAEWLARATGQRYRLPSEAEFEFALRAGSAGPFAWGAGRPPADVGNLTGDGDRSRSKRLWAKAFEHYRDGFWGPAPVGRFTANALGLHDLEGNVSEWVEDCWHASYLRAPDDGSAWVNRGCSKRVVRGGSWGSEPDQARVAFRLGVAADTRSARVGFRVAREL